MFIDIKEVQGAFIINPKRYQDKRGYFQEHFNSLTYKDKIQCCEQISFSKSHKNVVRGLHCAQYGKLVQCVQGSIIDYMVDLREESPTYLKWAAVKLSENDARQVYIPPRCGHGVFSKEDNSLLVYCQEGTFNAIKEMNVNPFDPLINIVWPSLLPGEDYIISDQDKNAPNVNEARTLWNEKNKK